jgi:hypothetical protein
MSADLDREELIARYLLGDLPEEQQTQIEDRAFSDQEYRRIISAVENDLIDEYVRSELSGIQRRQFEDRFLASADRRRRVEFARALTTLISEVPATEIKKETRAALSTPATWRESLAAFFGGFTPAFKFSLVAATLLLFVSGAWLITQTIRQRAQLARLQSEEQLRQNERRALEGQIDNERKRNQELTAQLESEKQQRRQSDDLINQLQKEVENPPQPSPRNTILSLALLPGISRSGGVHPKLVLDETVRAVRLRIGVEPEEPYKTFQIELRGQNGRQIWTRDNLPARTSSAGKTIALTLPTSVLTAGQYELALRGVTENKTTEEVGYYYFDVVKK